MAGELSFLRISNVDGRLLLTELRGSVIRIQVSRMFGPACPFLAPWCFPLRPWTRRHQNRRDNQQCNGYPTTLANCTSLCAERLLCLVRREVGSMAVSMVLARNQQFVCYQSMDVREVLGSGPETEVRFPAASRDVGRTRYFHFTRGSFRLGFDAPAIALCATEPSEAFAERESGNWTHT